MSHSEERTVSGGAVSGYQTCACSCDCEHEQCCGYEGLKGEADVSDMQMSANAAFAGYAGRHDENAAE